MNGRNPKRFAGRSFGAIGFVVVLGLLLTVKPVMAITEAPTNHPAANVQPVSPGNVIPQGQASSIPALPPGEDIRDIRPPYHISPGWMWLVWTASGVALAALCYLIWRWRRRIPSICLKPAYVLALERLAEARNLMQPDHAREFSIQVSEVVRSYIESRFGARASHLTTEEFLRACVAETDSPLMGHQPLLGDFLNHCDLAKFARWVLSIPEMEAMLQSATDFVRETGMPDETQSSAAESSTGKIAGRKPQPLNALSS